MRKGLGLLCALCALLVVPASSPAAAGQLKVGVGVSDGSWHVGASAGQYATWRVEGDQGNPFGPNDVFHEFDPQIQSIKNKPSYGMQSRLTQRAVVIEEAGGKLFAIVKHDLYLSQDLLFRRAAQLASEYTGGKINRENLVISATHNHSSPYYTSTAWGAWTFQDVFDIRAYGYYAEAIARAVDRAYDNRKDAKITAAVGPFAKTNRNALGSAKADDGSQAGFPKSFTDRDMTVLRFDEKDTGKAIGTLVNFSLHPESLDGNDLISADYLGPLERMVDRATGAPVIWTQNAVGTSEPENSEYHNLDERLEFSHKEYVQTEHSASLMSKRILDLRDGKNAAKVVTPGADAKVDVADGWFPGPLSHPYPAVSNCRTATAVGGNPQAPVVGLPDCKGPGTSFKPLFEQAPAPFQPLFAGISQEEIKRKGIPVPDNYGALAFTGLEENVDVHLQAMRIGEILFTVCACEQWADQSKNIKSRTDKVAGNDWKGFDWSKETQDDGVAYPFRTNERQGTLPNRNDPDNKPAAQIYNDAYGWNRPEYVSQAESEPADAGQIKGNFTQDDTQASADRGYELTVPISMANDYNGYIATYREYQRGDHYRKALTGWGPHSSDYMATRMVKLARFLRDGFPMGQTTHRTGGDDVDYTGDAMLGAAIGDGRGSRSPQEAFDALKATPFQPAVEAVNPASEGAGVPFVKDSPPQPGKVQADLIQQEARAFALGNVARGVTAAYSRALPADSAVAITKHPDPIERFDAAIVKWDGGSNFFDNPEVTVQRQQEDGSWATYADGTGQVVTTIKFPSDAEIPSQLPDGAKWRWTASFEAFSPGYDLVGEKSTPPGTYRFKIAGRRHAKRGDADGTPYSLESNGFKVGQWAGITVVDFQKDADDRVSFEVGPTITRKTSSSALKPEGLQDTKFGPIDYPDTWKASDGRPKFIRDVKWRREDNRPNIPEYQPRQAPQFYCVVCTFRPWEDVGDAATALVTFNSATKREKVPATKGGDGRWRTERSLGDGENAYVCPGDVKDKFGNVSGTLSQPVGGGTINLDACQALVIPDPKPDPKPDTGGGGGSGGGSEPATAKELKQAETAESPFLAENLATSLGLPVPATAKPGCIGRRSLKIKVQTPYRKVKVRSASILVDGKVAKRLKGGKRTVTLKKLPSRAVTVTVKVRGSDGRLYAASRRYKTCA